MRWYIGAIVLLGVVSCAPSEDQQGVPETLAHRQSLQDRSAGIPLEEIVGDCPVDSSARHENPVVLVEEFARRDAEGSFDGEDVARVWHAAALSCVERATSDHYEIIGNVRVAAGPQGGDSVVVYVSRDRLYYPEYDEAGRIIRLEPAPGRWEDTVLVVNTTLGWRIHKIHGGAHRLPGIARGDLPDLEPEYVQVLDSLASRPGV